MTYTEFIRNYLQQQEPGVPIYIDEIANSMAADYKTDKKKAALATSVAMKRIMDSSMVSDVRCYQKGIYYRTAMTPFGEMGINREKLIAKKYLLPDKGYVTGWHLLYQMGLTTQITQELLIGTNKYRRPLMRNGYKVRFLKQDNVITEENVELLRLLDAIRLIREIPAVTPDEACKTLMGLIQMLTDERRSEMALLALKYTNYVRALVGAMFEQIGVAAPMLRGSLNWTSSYEIPVSERALPTKRNWRIV